MGEPGAGAGMGPLERWALLINHNQSRAITSILSVNYGEGQVGRLRNPHHSWARQQHLVAGQITKGGVGETSKINKYDENVDYGADAMPMYPAPASITVGGDIL